MEKENMIFINGMGQAIDILKSLPLAQRQKILMQMHAKNPNMAKELMVKSYSFENILNSSEHTIATLFSYVSAPILGISLKYVAADHQKRVLRSIDRTKAEEAYRVLKTKTISPLDCQRAQSKVLDIAHELMNKQLIQL